MASGQGIRYLAIGEVELVPGHHPHDIGVDGLDLFSVKLHILGGRYSGVTVEKSNPSMYVALAEVVDHMLEALNRFGDRNRVKERKKAR